MTFDNKGTMAAFGTLDGTVSIVDVNVGRVLHSFQAPYTVSSIAFHPSRKLMAFSTFDRDGDANVIIVDTGLGRVVARLSADRRGVHLVRFSADGKLLASVGAEEKVRIWAVNDLVGK